MNRFKTQTGFSLVELMVIGGVTALSLTVAGTYLYSINNEMKQKAMLGEVNEITKYVEFVFTHGPTCTENFKNIQFSDTYKEKIGKIIKYDDGNPPQKIGLLLGGKDMNSRDVFVDENNIELAGTFNLGSGQYAGRLNLTFTPRDSRYKDLSFHRHIGVSFKMAGPQIERCSEGAISAEDQSKTCQMLYGSNFTYKEENGQGQCVDKYLYQWFTTKGLKATCPSSWEPRYPWDNGGNVWGDGGGNGACGTAFPKSADNPYNYNWIHNEFYWNASIVPPADKVVNPYTGSNGTQDIPGWAPMAQVRYTHSDKTCTSYLSSRMPLIGHYDQWGSEFSTSIHCRQLR